jgi:glycosyltransferase involved in cell wall biosynthesis
LVPVNYLKGLKRAYLIPYVSIQKRFLKKTKSKIILTNSLFSSKVFECLYSLKPFVIYPPVDVENFSLKPKENLVISVGRFDPFKKYEILIEAFSRVENGRCFILGSIHNKTSARYFNKLQMLIKRFKVDGKVKLMVNSPFNVLKNILSIAKIYVHCAPFEYFGISIVEAMACGCVPIVYRGGGAYLDVIDKGNYGLAFGNINELIDGINLLLEDDYLFRNLSQKVVARSKIFSKQNFKKKFLKLVD